MAGLPSYVYKVNGKLYCAWAAELKDLLDGGYESKCKKCPIKDRCHVVKEYKTLVPGDFHTKNAEVFFPEEFAAAPDKYAKKALRAKAKILGLGLLYGGNTFTIQRQMNISKEDAAKIYSNYMSGLPTLCKWMGMVQNNILVERRIHNLFGYWRYVPQRYFDEIAASKEGERKYLGFVKRTALNNGQQSSGAAMLKIIMYQVLQLIRKNNWDCLSEYTIPRKLRAGYNYTDQAVVSVFSVHDEVDYFVRKRDFDELISAVYKVSMIEHVMKDFLKTKVFITADNEYDISFSASNLNPIAKLFVYMEQWLPTSNIKLLDDYVAPEKEQENDSVEVDSQDNPQFIQMNLQELLKAFLKVQTEDSLKLLKYKYIVYVDTTKNIRFKSNVKFPLQMLDQLNVVYK